MERLSLKEISKVTGGKLSTSFETISNIYIENISTDTRTLKKGDLFIALKGEKFDGYDFVQEAFKKGAKGAIIQSKSICDCELKVGNFVISVPDTLLSLGKIANYYLGKFSPYVIGITGSSGKTTTREMIAHLLSLKFKVLKNKENFNNEIGLPLTIFNLEKCYEVVVLEMAARSKIDDIKYLCSIAPPDVSVITNIGVSHIEQLGSRENIFKAKREIIYNRRKNGTGILNYDDRYLKKLIKETNKNILTFGLKNKADIFAEDIETKTTGFEFTLHIKKENLKKMVFLPLLGYHNIYNLLSAVAVGKVLGIDLDGMIEKIANFKIPPQRGEVISLKRIKVLSDFYNASPPSVKSALWTLKNQIKGKRKIAVLGDMKELGKISCREHRKIGELAAQSDIDILITVGDKSRYILEEAKGKIKKIFHFEKNKEAGEKLKNIIKPEDVVLIKGSRSLHLEEIFEILKNNA